MHGGLAVDFNQFRVVADRRVLEIDFDYGTGACGSGALGSCQSGCIRRVVIVCIGRSSCSFAVGRTGFEGCQYVLSLR